MAEEQVKTGYGFADDEQESNARLIFGLNAGVTRLVKFEFNPNGGKEGAEQEALDIVFEVDEKTVSYRQFPVTKAFDKDGNEVTDPRAPAMVSAQKSFNAVITHILKAFRTEAEIQQAFQVPIASFREYCNICANILPKDYQNVVLDIFAQWQWEPTGENTKTYLRLPKNMKHGFWLCKHIPPVGGKWEEVRLNDKLSYKDAEGNIHPFKRSAWFMTSNFAKQQAEESLDAISAGQQNAENKKWENEQK